MGWLGDLIAAPIRIANVPMKCLDRAVRFCANDEDDEDMTARPLEALAQEIEDAVDPED